MRALLLTDGMEGLKNGDRRLACVSALRCCLSASALVLAVAVSAQSVVQTAVAASAAPAPGPAEIAAMHHAVASVKAWRAVCNGKTFGKSAVQTYRVIRPDRMAGSVTVGSTTIEIVQVGRTQYYRTAETDWKRGVNSRTQLAALRDLATQIDKGLSYTYLRRSSFQGEPVSIYRVTMRSSQSTTRLGSMHFTIGIARGMIEISTQRHLPVKESMLVPMSISLPTGTRTMNTAVDCHYYDYNGKDIEISAPEMSPPLPYFAPTPTTAPSPLQTSSPAPVASTPPSPAPSV